MQNPEITIDSKQQIPYIQFERVAVEDPVATLAAGQYVAKDVDMVNITPAYSKDIIKCKAVNWLAQNKVDEKNGRLSQEWRDRYEKAYEAFKNGQELPLEGTPIKGWGVISPAQQETLIRLRILTVESLAGINAEGISRLGMGAIDLRNKAQAWLDTLHKNGKPTIQLAAQKKKIEQLEANLERMTGLIKELTNRLNKTDNEAVDLMS